MNAVIAMPAVHEDAGAAGVHHGDVVASRQVLCLAVGRETYGIGIDMVREILEVGRLTPLPLTPPFVRGVMNLRGAVVPVIDLMARFGEPPAEVGTLVVGALVDGVSEVLDVLTQDIEPVPPLGTRIPREFIQGMAKAKGSLLSVLDMDRVLDRETLATLIGGHIEQLGQAGGRAPQLSMGRVSHADL